MIVRFTDEADSDLELIGDYIAQDNPVRAIGFVSELREACRGLGRMPQAFSFVRGHEASGVRRRVHGSYLIFYRVESEAVVVLRVLHGSMHYSSVLFPEDG